MENYSAGYSHPSSLLPDDDISDINNTDNNPNNNNNNNEEAEKGVTKSLLTEPFFQNVLGFRGTMVSWQTFEVSELSMCQDSRKPSVYESSASMFAINDQLKGSK